MPPIAPFFGLENVCYLLVLEDCAAEFSVIRLMRPQQVVVYEWLTEIIEECLYVGVSSA